MLREEEERCLREGVGCVLEGRSSTEEVGVSCIAEVEADEEVEVVERTEEVWARREESSRWRRFTLLC